MENTDSPALVGDRVVSYCRSRVSDAILSFMAKRTRLEKLRLMNNVFGWLAIVLTGLVLICVILLVVVVSATETPLPALSAESPIGLTISAFAALAAIGGFILSARQVRREKAFSAVQLKRTQLEIERLQRELAVGNSPSSASVFIRISGIELKPPLLKQFFESTAGLIVWCEALEGADDETKAKLLLDLEGSTHSVTWQGEDGWQHDQIMQILSAKAESRKSPDGKTITSYSYALTEV
jgi:hypothetical protein